MCKQSTACVYSWSPTEDKCYRKWVGELVPAMIPGLHPQIPSGFHHCAPSPTLFSILSWLPGADLIFQTLHLEASMVQP